MSEGEPARNVSQDPGFGADDSTAGLGRVIRGAATPTLTKNFSLRGRMFSFCPAAGWHPPCHPERSRRVWGQRGGPRCMTDVRFFDFAHNDRRLGPE